MKKLLLVFLAVISFSCSDDNEQPVTTECLSTSGVTITSTCTSTDYTQYCVTPQVRLELYEILQAHSDGSCAQVTFNDIDGISHSGFLEATYTAGCCKYSN